jgi:hypothetical protein
MMNRRWWVILASSVAAWMCVASGSVSAETLTDRCSGAVRIPPHYGDGPDAPGYVEIRRGSKSTPSFTGTLHLEVNMENCPKQLGCDRGKFRWYCLPKGESNWSDEQSRCDAGDKNIRARLGANKLVNFDCMGDPTPDPSGSTGSGNAGTGNVGQACGQHDFCFKGGACNLASGQCEAVSINGCGQAGQSCCQMNSADPIGCVGGTQCATGLCQPCGGSDQLCCGGGNLAEKTCNSGVACSGGFCPKATMGSGSQGLSISPSGPTVAAVHAATGDGVALVIRQGAQFARVYSTDQGSHWWYAARRTAEGLIQPINVIGSGAFQSGPAAALSADGKQMHVFGRGQDNRIWQALSLDGGIHWTLAWAPIGEGVFKSEPAAAVSADGKRLHVFALGTDDRIWRAYSIDGGKTWAVAWEPIGSGTFNSAPAAAISADGKRLQVFGVGTDNRIWRAFSADAGAHWNVAWSPIGDGVFSSAPAAAMSADGQRVNIMARGQDNRIWRAYSADGGSNWSVAWAPIGQGIFSSAPTVAMSADGKMLHVFGRGMPGPSSGGFPSEPAIWRAFSPDGGATWTIAWSPIELKAQP